MSSSANDSNIYVSKYGRIPIVKSDNYTEWKQGMRLQHCHKATLGIYQDRQDPLQANGLETRTRYIRLVCCRLVPSD